MYQDEMVGASTLKETEVPAATLIWVAKPWIAGSPVLWYGMLTGELAIGVPGWVFSHCTGFMEGVQPVGGPTVVPLAPEVAGRSR